MIPKFFKKIESILVNFVSKYKFLSEYFFPVILFIYNREKLK